MAITPIKLDFSQAERSSYNTRHMPAGIYEAKIVEVIQKEAQDGTPMLVYAITPTHPQYRGRRFPFYCKLSDTQLWKLRDLLVAAGEDIPRRAVRVQPEKVVNRLLCIEVGDDTYNGNVRSTIESVYPWDVLRPEEKFSEKDSLDNEDDSDDDDEPGLSLVPQADSMISEDLDADDFEGDSDFDDEDLDMTPKPPKKKAKKAKKVKKAE